MSQVEALSEIQSSYFNAVLQDWTNSTYASNLLATQDDYETDEKDRYTTMHVRYAKGPHMMVIVAFPPNVVIGECG